MSSLQGRDSQEAAWTGDSDAGPTVSRILLGSQLRELRESAGISQDRAAAVIRGSSSKISRLEAGRLSFKSRDLDDLFDLYGLRDEVARETLLALAAQANAPAWWQPFRDAVPGSLEAYLGLEPSASLIRTYDVQFIPPLLRTAEYTRAVLRSVPGAGDATILEQQVSLAMRRQELLQRADPPRLWAVIDEAALRRPVGGADVLRGQLEHLIAVTDLDHVTIQVMPLSAGLAAAGGPITLLRFPHEGLGDVVFLEQLATAFYVTKAAECGYYMSVLNQMVTTARTPSETTGVLRSMLASL
jgi:transcriptional regulator with XRE-family HTH domain